jgi:DcaP outer membrane protein
MNKKTNFLVATGMAALLLPAWSSADDNLAKRVEMLEQQLILSDQLLQELRAEMKQTVEVAEKASKASNSGFKGKANTTYSFGGFIKADAMWSEHSDQRRAGNVGDVFLVPSTIATGDGSGKGDKVFDANAKTSRIWFKTVSDTDAGPIKSYIEFDFRDSSDERVTNRSDGSLRHAFVDWQYSDTASLLAGQTWSTFFNVGALPEAVDFIGPTSGTLFVRQTQVRWTKKVDDGSIMLAAENPSTGLIDGDGDLMVGTGISGSSFDDSTMPDLVARYNGKAGDLSYSAAVMGRDIAYKSGAMDDNAYGFAVSLAGKYVFDNGDDVKFMVNHGNLGRYIALQAFREGSVQADGDIDLLDVTGGFVAYRHLWTERLRSTLMYAMASADNSSTVDPSLTTESISNANLNLIYSPTKALSFGIEYIVADRELENGVDGDLKRLQFMTKYVF